MLIDSKILKQAITDLSLRNQLLTQLVHCHSTDPKRIQKRALAWLLGANLNQHYFERSSGHRHPISKVVQYFLSSACLYDQLISSSEITVYKKKQIIESYYSLLQEFNENFEWYENSTNHEIAKLVLNELYLRTMAIKMFCPESSEVIDSHSYIEQLKTLNLNKALSLIVTNAEGDLYIPDFEEHKDFVCHTELLRASDGSIIESLRVKPRRKNFEAVVLCMVGQNPYEKYYVSKRVYEYAKLFGEVVFVNHRNYSKRSGKIAGSLDELAQDILAFAKFHQSRGKQVVLYGMCGGGPVMVNAAMQLYQSNQQFKLILDRTFDHYAHVIDSKNIDREEYREFNEDTWRDYFFKRFVMYGVNPLWKIGLKLSGIFNQSFSEIVQQLPTENILVLQGKGEKIVGTENRVCNDGTIHPDYNIRNALKPKRKAIKNALNDLIELSMLLSMDVKSKELKVLFLNFSNCFRALKKEVSNEKLTASNEVSQHYDGNIHGTPLFDLKPRSGMAINSFISGFIKQHSVELQVLLDDFSNPDKFESTSETFDKWLDLVLNNKKMIVSLASRVAHSQGENLLPLFKQLKEIVTASRQVNVLEKM